MRNREEWESIRRASELEEENRKRRLRRRRPLLLLVLSVILESDSRKWYILPGSQHWAQGIFDGNQFTEEQFQYTFRMSTDTFWDLHEMLSPYISKRERSSFRDSIPSERRLAIFLYYVAQGVTLNAVSNQFGCGETTAWKIVSETVDAILHNITRKYVRFSTQDEALRSMDYWYSSQGIPGVVDCIDRIHVPIMRPNSSGDAYFNQKSLYSLNVQGIMLPLAKLTEQRLWIIEDSLLILLLGGPGLCLISALEQFPFTGEFRTSSWRNPAIHIVHTRS
jgi:hypothetical protein